VIGLAVLATVGVALAVGNDSDGSQAAGSGDGGAEAPSTSSVVEQLTPDQAFTVAAERLETAGSFGYHGASSATDVSLVRPGPWVSVDVTVVGDVDLSSGRVHEFAVSTTAQQVAETVTDGSGLWARVSSDPDLLPTLSFEPVGQLADGASVRSSGALLPGWLAATVGHQDAGVDQEGRRQFRATLPAAALGEIEREQPAVDAEILLTFDDGGNPARVEVTTAPTGPRLHLALDISKVGDPIAIEVPTATASPAA
jgi:hypothetical protein